MTTNTIATPRSASAAPNLHAQYRARLEQQWHQQLGDIIDLSNDERGTSNEPDNDGSRATDQILSARLIAAARKQLDETAEALARLDDGTYGTCADCGEQINSERLEILPAASYCVACQSRRTGR
jgi:RNA polymerase-binding transcription factor DksA